MEIRCVIVEDEPLALSRMRQYVGKVPSLHLQATCRNGLEASQYLKENNVDLIFLDINIGELSGIELMETSNINSQVIFTTAYPEYALKGYDLNVTDFLLKPFTLERFEQSVKKAEEKFVLAKIEVPKTHFFIKSEYNLEKVLIEDLIYIEGMRDYRKLHMRNKSLMTLMTFRELEQEVPPFQVCRVHKSYMVAIDKIETVKKDEIIIGKISIPLSDSYRKHFKEALAKSK